MFFVARIAMPAMFASFAEIVDFFAKITIPAPIRTFLVQTVSFKTFIAKPGFVTRFVPRMRFLANGTKPGRF